MIGRILSWIALFAIGVLVVTLSVANRQWVMFSLDPFHAKDPVIFLQLPMWSYLLAMFGAGAVVGWIVTLIGQGKWRKLARTRAQEAMRWKGEADRLARERDAAATAAAGGSRQGASGSAGGRKLLEIARR